MILLDFSKAFDKVPHKRLLLKVACCGIAGSILAWIEDFLHSRTQKVVLGGQSSCWAPVTSGVPQGCELGPLLFLLYTNDLPDCVTSSTARLHKRPATVVGHMAHAVQRIQVPSIACNT